MIKNNKIKMLRISTSNSYKSNKKNSKNLNSNNNKNNNLNKTLTLLPSNKTPKILNKKTQKNQTNSSWKQNR